MEPILTYGTIDKVVHKKINLGLMESPVAMWTTAVQSLRISIHLSMNWLLSRLEHSYAF